MSKQIDLTSTSRVSVRRAPNLDRTADKSTLRFYTIETISPHRSYTPEGYLLCEEATLSRTGTMLYKQDEVPVTPGSDGLVTVVRYEEDVFKPESIASANGKSVCNNHPAEGQDITPENWRALEVGVILHPRRGTGEKRDCLVGDLLIKDEEAIKLIESGKVQLSCGYDAEYEELKPGFAKQTEIIINHVAIVENGRCGPRCAIMDEDTLRLNSPLTSGKTNIEGVTMAKINDALANLTAALNKTSTTRDTSMVDNTAAVEAALDVVSQWLDKVEGHLRTRDRGRDDDDDRRSRDRRDVRRRDDDDDDRRSRDRRDARRRDDDDEEEEEHFTDRYHRDDDDDDDDRRSRDRRDARRRDEDDDRRSRDRRDARRRRDEAEEEDEHVADKRKRDESELAMEAGEKNKDRARKSKDSAFLEDSWQDTISLAECLLPGVQSPKFTRDAAPTETLDKLCKFRKGVLETAFTKAEGRKLILQVNRGEVPDFSGMSCGAARTLFRDCAIIAKTLNNMSTADSGATTFGLVTINNPVISNPASFNEWAAKHWETQYPTKAVN